MKADLFSSFRSSTLRARNTRWRMAPQVAVTRFGRRSIGIRTGIRSLWRGGTKEVELEFAQNRTPSFRDGFFLNHYFFQCLQVKKKRFQWNHLTTSPPIRSPHHAVIGHLWGFASGQNRNFSLFLLKNGFIEKTIKGRIDSWFLVARYVKHLTELMAFSSIFIIKPFRGQIISKFIHFFEKISKL